MSTLDELNDDFITNLEDHECISVRRKRRCSNAADEQRDSQIKAESNSTLTAGMATPPATPHRTKKRVRFSEPASSGTTTGLTPFFCRNSISSPPPARSRRASTPSRLNLAVDDTLIISGTLQFGPLRQALSGRSKRALSRRGMSEEQHKIEMEDKLALRAEIECLNQELHQNGQEMQDVSGAQKIKDLEIKVAELQAKLHGRQLGSTVHDDEDRTVIADDPFNEDPSFLPMYDGDFNVDMTDILTSTPRRTSFPSPPETMPNTPSRSAVHIDLTEEGGVVDEQRIHLESQLKALQDELENLRKVLELTNTTHERLSAKLSPFMDESEATSEANDSLDLALDSVLTRLALTQSSALDSANRFSALANELTVLFPLASQDPESTIKAIQDQFHTSRLELEYLAPGENPEGFDNTKLLDMLIARLRMLTKKVTQQDTDIDQYHAQEMSLRQQLGSRIDCQTVVQDSLANAGSEILKMGSDIQDRDDSISKLTQALQGYRDEVTGLESLVTRLEAAHTTDLTTMREEMEKEREVSKNKILDSELQRDILQATAEGREIIVAELEKRLSAALTSSQTLQDKMAKLEEERDSAISAVSQLQQSALDRENAHGDALALRDARVSELREEVERVNASLKDAHSTIMTLKRDKRDLNGKVEADNALKETVMGILVASGTKNPNVKEFAPGPPPSSVREDGHQGSGPIIVKPLHFQRMMGTGGQVDSPAAMKMGKKRRRYDSGLGFLEEEDEEVAVTKEI